MDGQGGRGAYHPVTTPNGEDGHVTIKPGGNSSGTSSFDFRKKLISGIVVAVVAIVIVAFIIIGVVVGNNKASSSEKPVVLVNTTMAPKVSSVMTTTPTPLETTAVPTTLGPPVRGSFTGEIVLDTPYLPSYDDVRAPSTAVLKDNFTAAVDEVYQVPSANTFLYASTVADQLVKNGSYVKVYFTVSLDAINRGGRDHLLTTIGTIPSDVLNTFSVLSVHLDPEQKLQLDA